MSDPATAGLAHFVSSLGGRGTSGASKYIEERPSHCRPLGESEERRERNEREWLLLLLLFVLLLVVYPAATSTAATVCLDTPFVFFLSSRWLLLPTIPSLRLIYDTLV